jgi:hypothetical protein
MTNYHIVKVKYLPATTYKGSRVKMISERFPNNSLVIDYDYQYNDALSVASAWLNSHGYPVIGQGESQTIAGYLILGSDGNGFEKLYK